MQFERNNISHYLVITVLDLYLTLSSFRSANSQVQDYKLVHKLNIRDFCTIIEIS